MPANAASTPVFGRPAGRCAIRAERAPSTVIDVAGDQGKSAAFRHSRSDRWGGVTASCIATCPRVWRAMNGPQLCIDMRSILLYLLGEPIPIIILIALFWH